MKRRLLIIGMFLLLGAVVNVAVAWGCALGPLGSSTSFETTEAGLLEWPRPVPGGWPPPRRSSYRMGFGLRCEVIDANDPGRPKTSHVMTYLMTVYEAGWPYRSLRCEWVQSATWSRKGFRDEWRGALPIPSFRVPLPLNILWGGFILDTTTYMVILWLLSPGLSALRRFLRLRRGLCPKCAYPIGESAVCTECGEALAKHAGG